MTQPTVLYRLFDSQGRLLYVGITCGPRERFKAHHGEKDWWPRVVGCTFEHFETRRQALTAESEAIKNERPVFNVSGRSPALTELVQQAEYAREPLRLL